MERNLKRNPVAMASVQNIRKSLTSVSPDHIATLNTSEDDDERDIQVTVKNKPDSKEKNDIPKMIKARIVSQDESPKLRPRSSNSSRERSRTRSQTRGGNYSKERNSLRDVPYNSRKVLYDTRRSQSREKNIPPRRTNDDYPHISNRIKEVLYDSRGQHSRDRSNPPTLDAYPHIRKRIEETARISSEIHTDSDSRKGRLQPAVKKGTVPKPGYYTKKVSFKKIPETISHRQQTPALPQFQPLNPGNRKEKENDENLAREDEFDGLNGDLGLSVVPYKQQKVYMDKMDLNFILLGELIPGAELNCSVSSTGGSRKDMTNLHFYFHYCFHSVFKLLIAQTSVILVQSFLILSSLPRQTKCAIKFPQGCAEYSDEKTMGDLDDEKMEVGRTETSAKGLHPNQIGRSTNTCCNSEADHVTYMVIPNRFATPILVT